MTGRSDSREEDGASEGGDVVTLLERMVSAGIDEARARDRLDRGCVRVAGETVTDPSFPVPWPTPRVIATS